MLEVGLEIQVPDFLIIEVGSRVKQEEGCPIKYIKGSALVSKVGVLNG